MKRLAPLFLPSLLVGVLAGCAQPAPCSAVEGCGPPTEGGSVSTSVTDETPTTSPTSTSPTPDNCVSPSGPVTGTVGEVMNGRNRSAAKTHWEIREGSGLNWDVAFYCDGTLDFRSEGYARIWPYNWTQTGDAALVVDSNAYASSFHGIDGSVSVGAFDAQLGSNPAMRHFGIAGGAMSPAP